MAITGCQLQNVTAAVIQLPPVHASDAELGPDLLPAHPLSRRRRTLVPVGADASLELPLRLGVTPGVRPEPPRSPRSRPRPGWSSSAPPPGRERPGCRVRLSGSHAGGRKSAASNCARICALTCAFSELTGPVPGRAGGLEGRVRRGPEPLGMIALEALIGGPPEISGPVEPLVRPIRIPLRRKLISEAAWNFASCLAHSR
jgi:hypothetical protein